MERIILNRNLKFVLEPLNVEQRGELLTAIFNGAYRGVDHAVDNVFQYIKCLQEETENKRLKMKEIGAIGRAAQKKLKSDAAALSLQLKKRKETKEIGLNNNLNNIISFSPNSSKATDNDFEPPSLEAVSAFIKQQELNVKPDTFINFYQARGWKIGTVPMQNWQAILRLWHARAEKRALQKKLPPYMQADDEIYWQQLQSRALKNTEENTTETKEAAHECE